MAQTRTVQTARDTTTEPASSNPAPISKASARKKPATKAPAPKTRAKNRVTNEPKKPKDSLYIYIYAVLKQVHPQTGITNRSMSVLNSCLMELFDKIATEAVLCAKICKRTTISSRDVQTAARLICPGQLAIHAINEGTKAVTKYTVAVRG